MTEPKGFKGVFAISKMVSKLNKIRDKGDTKTVIDLLQGCEYFKKVVNNPDERSEFLRSAVKYAKYKYFPKGTIIRDYNETVTCFSVCVKGKALLYTSKDSHHITKEYNDSKKSQVIQEYVQYIGDTELEQALIQWLNNRETGTRTLRKRMGIPTSQDPLNPAKKGPLTAFTSVVESILIPKNPLLSPYLRDHDISLGEKLLLISHFGKPGDYLKHGVFSIEATQPLTSNDAFDTIGLMKSAPVGNAVIAAEDVYIVSFMRDDYRLLYSQDLVNPKEKIEFLSRIFTEVSRGALVKIAHFLEERIFTTRDTIYKEGEDSKAIYFIKKGEVQLITHKSKNLEATLLENPKSKSGEKIGSKLKIVVGNLQAGAMFGEEDVIGKHARKYTVVSIHPQTFVYVLHSEVYTQVFEKHFPHMASIFQDWVKIKSIWRKQRIGAEEELAEQREPGARQISRNENRDSRSQFPQNVQQYFYVSTKDSYDGETETNGSVNSQNRLAFRIVADQNANRFAETTPKKVSVQSRNEHQLSHKTLSDREVSGKARSLMTRERSAHSRENRENRHIRPPSSFRPSTTDNNTPRNFASVTTQGRLNHTRLRERGIPVEDNQASKTENSLSLLPTSSGYSTVKNFASFTVKTKPSPRNHALKLTPKEPLVSVNSERSFRYTSPFRPVANSIAILKADSCQSLEDKTSRPKGYLRLRPKLVESLKEIENISLSKGSTQLLKRMISNKHEDLSENENTLAALDYGISKWDQFYPSCSGDKRNVRNPPRPRLSKVPSLLDLDSRGEIHFLSDRGKLDSVQTRPSEERSIGQIDNKKSGRKIIKKDGKKVNHLVINTLQLDIVTDDL